ncbi:MAG: hypothetical protein SFV22_08075 [Saprospiraceae bacterium]|nr:hypothetical protein [Saprospiraceae bacterium]
MNNKFFLALLLGLSLTACKKNNDPEDLPPPTPTCEVIENDTLMILYPCNGQTGFTGDRFTWQFGPMGAQLPGIVELRIKKLDPPFGIYNEYNWNDQNNPKAFTTLSGTPFALQANTRYEWYMSLRHDGNGLYYHTPKQTFVTGETGFNIPVSFNKFPGTYAVTDTFFERVQVWTSPSSWYLEDRPPVAQSDKVITIESIPNENIFISGIDTITYMNLRIGPNDTYKISINDKGSIFWSNGTYYTSNTLSGHILGDSIACTLRSSSNMSGIFSGHHFRGRR